MHLTQVHMENFKSFGRKLTVPFEPGFTAITGPNGSGKSNIGDAILFVLGPNSPRAIRAGRLTDLIFNGGEHGKGAQHCQVSLVFDNKDRTMPVDADEVTLTRKVKRAPTKEDPDAYHSYFYVNGRASQKKEFVDLLNHARISADGYNITQQGDVLHICQMSNVERRRILDDIAGVTAFDTDIQKADGRRKEVEENLQRIGIVLDEIERSLAQLEKEKESAQRFQELQKGIAAAKGRMAWRRKADFEAQVAQVQQQIAQFDRERTRLQEELRGHEEKQKELQRLFAEAEQRIRAEGGEEVQEIQDRLEQARDRMVRLEEKINYAKAELRGGKEETAPLQDELRRVRKEAERTARVRDECALEAGKAGEELAARKAELERIRDQIGQADQGALSLNRDLAKLKQEHEEKQLKLHEAKLEADRLAERLATAEKAAAEAERLLADTTKDLEETAWQAGELRKNTQGSGKRRKELERRLFDLRKAQAEFTKQGEDLENRIRRLQREQAELQAQIDAAARAGRGSTHAVELLLRARDAKEIRGIVGTVGELAKVEKRFETALEVAAGPSMQALIVEDDAVAAQCIDLLKKQKAGVAKLFPLNKMAPGRPRGQALMAVKQNGCLGFALDLIEFNPRYQNAFWAAFGDTLVVDTMDTGRRLMGGVRLVSLEGELFEAGGAMIGGSRGKKEGSAFANVDRSQLDKIMQEAQDAERAQEALFERLASVRAELATLQAELDDGGRADVGAEERLRELEKREVALRERQATGAEERARLEAEAASLREQQAANAAAVAQSEARLVELARLRDEKGQMLLRGSKKEWRERLEALDKEIRELQEQTLKAENRRDVAAKQLELVEARVREVEAQIGAREKEREAHQQTVATGQEELRKAKGEVEALMQMERKATSALKGLREERDRLYEKLTELKARMEKTADRMETHYGLVANAKAKLPALEEGLAEALLDLKEHPVEVAPGEEVPSQDDLRRHIRNLEAQLERLGPVNMRALEEYEAQSERRRGLKDEVQRLEEQRGELVNLVAEITQKKKGALLEVFGAISENFAQVYARLSLGGKAVMELENPEDPFTGGLILKAQPMGKRVTRLDALSGGEKSLTSMAFIFALQMYDPSPFYYLDEVDQNLDAVNSELLARLVRENSQYAQFILVSLRKVTLKEASHIYGVTQQTPGQSEVIANFDLQNLPDEGEAAEADGAGPAGDDGRDGDGTGDGGDGGRGDGGAGGGQRSTTVSRKKAVKEETLQQTFQRMVSVEVRQ